MSITVNGETVGESVIDQELATLKERYGEQLSPDELSEKAAELASDARENAIERVLLAQEARKSIPEISPVETDRRLLEVMQHYGSKEVPADVPAEEVTKMKSAIADGLRLEKYFALVCKDVPKPTKEDCRAYYDANAETFMSPEMIRASHIVRQPARGEDFGAFTAEMLNIRTQALNGGDFAKLAGQHSQCDDKGELGWFPRGSMVEGFEKVVFGMEAGQVSDVFRTEFGYHIAKVHEKRAPGPIPFESILKKIKEVLHEQRKNDEIGRVVDGLRTTANIVETPEKGSTSA
ncbi:MAG: peptidylprolyl isomerase [bacterium]